MAAAAELRLMRQVSRMPGQVVIGKPGVQGTRGADLISFNKSTGRVTLWDAKWRGTQRAMQQSMTFRKHGPLTNALDEAEKIIRASTGRLTPQQIHQALTSVGKGGTF
jgi:hypothetical protein